MTTMFVLWLVGRLLQQQPQRAVSTVDEGAPPLSLPQGCLSSAQKVPRSDVIGEKRGSRGKRRRREAPKRSSTSPSLRTVSRDQASASPSTQTDFPMRSDAPHPTRWMTAAIGKSVKQTRLLLALMTTQHDHLHHCHFFSLDYTGKLSSIIKNVTWLTSNCPGFTLLIQQQMLFSVALLYSSNFKYPLSFSHSVSSQYPRILLLASKK